jgi:hypothetical protein
MYKKSPLDPKGSDKRLEEEVRRDLSFLFTKHDARIISNCYYPRSFGNAVIVIQVGELFLQVVRDRGDIGVYVARSPITPVEGEWVELGVALAALQMERPGCQVPDVPFYATLSRAADLMQPKMSQLQGAFSKFHYEITLQKTRQITETNWKRFQEKISRKSQPRNLT